MYGTEVRYNHCTSSSGLVRLDHVRIRTFPHPPKLGATSRPLASTASEHSDSATLFPVSVQLTVETAKADEISLTAMVSTTVTLDDLVLSLKPAPDMRVVSSTLPQQLSRQANQSASFEVVIQSSATLPSRLDLNAAATYNKLPIGDLAVMFLAQRNGVLAQIPEPEALRILDAQRPKAPKRGNGFD